MIKGTMNHIVLIFLQLLFPLSCLILKQASPMGGYKKEVTSMEHTHTHEHTKAVINRLSRAIGHLESVKKMVEEGKDCSEVLIQLAAVKSAVNNTGKLILKDHIEHCIVHAIENDDKEAIEQLSVAIDRFMK